MNSFNKKAAVCLFPTLLNMAHAQDAAPSTELKPIVVQASSEDSPSKTAPTTASSRAELAKVPGGVEVIDSNRFLTGRASTFADTFALSPGVVAQSRFGSDEARISIRGSGLQRTFHGRGIRVLQDGVPINLADGSFDMQAIDPLATDHINVLRGSNALTLGSSTLGGAIDYISATGLTKPGGSVRLEAGSYDYLRSRVAIGGSEGDVDGYFSLSEAFQNGFRDHAKQHSQKLFGNVGWKLSDNLETRFYITGVNTDSELPGNLTKNELRQNPRLADPASIRLDTRRDFELYRIANKTTYEFGDQSLELISSFSYKDLDHPLTFGVVDQVSNDVLFGAIYTNESAFFNLENRFRAGLYFTYGETNSATLRNINGNRGALTADADQTATNAEAFIEDQLELGYGFTGVIGATFAHSRRRNEVLLGTAASYARDYYDVSPKMGLRWDASDKVQIYTNVSNSYEPPSFSEVNGSLAPNKAQTATTVELGTRGEHANMRWDASVYASELDGEFLSLVNAAGQPLGTTNADKTTHQGVELFGEVDLLGSSFAEDADNRLVARTAWTYGRFKFDDDAVFGDNTLAGLPPHLIRGELMWENANGYYAGPTFEWVPQDSFVDHANTFEADAYALLGFKFGRRVDGGLSWFVEFKNLTDKNYSAATGVVANAGTNSDASSRNFLPGDGRSVFAGVEYKW